MAKKILLFLFLFTFILHFYALSTSTVFGANELTCTASLVESVARGSGSTPNDTDKQIRLRIDVPPGAGRNVYMLIKFEGNNSYSTVLASSDPRGRIPVKFDVTDGKIEDIIGITGNGFYVKDNNNLTTFKPGNYTIALARTADASNPNPICTINNAINVKQSSTGPDNYCTVSYQPDNPNNPEENNDYTIPNTVVKIKVIFSNGANNTNDNDTHRVILKNKYGDQRWTTTTADLKNGWNIPEQLTVGTYGIEVREFSRDFEIGGVYDEGKRCTAPSDFLIETEQNGGGHVCSAETTGCDYTNIAEQDPLSQPCDSDNPSDYSDARGCLKIHTALGTIDTGAPEFVRWILGFVLGISGGIVLIIIIITGYKLMTSSGDPEKVKNAREALTAAIVGLLFIIFALVILQLITADILQLPGFGS